LNKGIHPSVIAEGFYKCAAAAVEVLQSIAIPVKIDDEKALTDAAITALNSKVVSQYADKLAPLAVKAVRRVIDPQRPNMVDLKDIKIVKKVGGTVEDTQLVDGLVFTQVSFILFVTLSSSSSSSFLHFFTAFQRSLRMY
jgi:T-complex protein 1 subunit delta